MVNNSKQVAALFMQLSQPHQAVHYNEPDHGRKAKNKPVGYSVVDGSDGGVALVIQGAVGHASDPKEGPDIRIAPVKDRIDPHEGGPASTAGAEGLLALGIGVPSASATLCDQAAFSHRHPRYNLPCPCVREILAPAYHQVA